MLYGQMLILFKFQQLKPEQLSQHLCLNLEHIIIMLINRGKCLCVEFHLGKMQTKSITLKRFDGGISDDIREPSSNKFSITKHFDIYSNSYRLTPYRDVEDDSGG